MKYVQRLERCEAVQFREVQQAPEIARLLGYTSWNLQYTQSNIFSLALQRIRDGGQPDISMTVENGDYVVVVHPGDTVQNYWLPRREFEQKYEAAE